jgi:orotate phosphoribosyltransferase
MSDDPLAALPRRRGHFLLESGYHTDAWFTLDALFVSPIAMAPHISQLAERLEPYQVSAVCGPLVGGAFVAQAVATRLGAEFYYSERVPAPGRTGLFSAEYRLSPELGLRLRGHRVAIVDDAISAGSSVRATVTAVTAAGATPAVIGALIAMGTEAIDYFAIQGIPMRVLAQRALTLWDPADCPHCETGTAIEDPTLG